MTILSPEKDALILLYDSNSYLCQFWWRCFILIRFSINCISFFSQNNKIIYDIIFSFFVSITKMLQKCLLFRLNGCWHLTPPSMVTNGLNLYSCKYSSQSMSILKHLCIHKQSCCLYLHRGFTVYIIVVLVFLFILGSKGKCSVHA